MRKGLLCLLLWGAGLSTRAQQSFFDTTSIIADTLHLVSGRFAFTEGPAVDKRGNIFFTDQPNNQIWEYDLNGRLTLYMDSTGRSNGMYFDRRGNLISCADEHDELWSIHPDKSVTVLVRNYEGHRLNGPNDLWVAPNGGIYFTDPYYQRDYWDRTTPDIAQQAVYYLPPGERRAAAGSRTGPAARAPLIADSNLVKPNGIVGTPDGLRLYVADIQANKTYVYRIGRGGVLYDRRLFVSQGSDGMTLDERGNLYLCGHGVTVYDSTGQKIAHIPVPAGWTANLCFGGRDKKTLLITASQFIFVLPMRVKGVE